MEDIDALAVADDLVYDDTPRTLVVDNVALVVDVGCDDLVVERTLEETRTVECAIVDVSPVKSDVPVAVSVALLLDHLELPCWLLVVCLCDEDTVLCDVADVILELCCVLLEVEVFVVVSL